MPSEKETVDDVAKDFEREREIHRMCKSALMSMWQATKYALRFQAAHRREVAELRDCLKEAVGYFCGEDRSDCSEKVYGNPKCEQEEICMVERWRKALERTEDGKADEPRK